MTRRTLYIAWGGLVALSLTSTLLSLPGVWAHWPAVSGITILVLAWLKARIILSQYLGLAAAPFWRRGFNFALAVLCLLMMGLYLIPLGL
jgi:hypothetical protein